MPGTFPLGSSDGIQCNFCLHERTDAFFTTIRSYAYLPISMDPNFLPRKFEGGTCLLLISL